MRNMFMLAGALVLALSLALPAGSLADDVTVKTIGPDKNPPSPTQPDKSTKPTTPTTPTTPTFRPPPFVMPGGDWLIGNAFFAAKVTGDQKAKLKDVLDDMARQAKDDQAKYLELMNKASAAAKAAKANGVKQADLASDPGVKAAGADLAKLAEENNTAMAARRDKLVAAMDGVLSADQIEQVKDTFDRSSPDLATRNKPLAKDWLKTSLPGLTLTADQQSQLMTTLAPVQKDFGQQLADLQKGQNDKMQALSKENPNDWQGNFKKVQDEFGPKMDELKLAMSKAMNAAIESQLTDEQKKQLAAGRAEAWKKSVLGWVDATLKSFDPAKLTDDQQAKAKELATAAGDAMLKTDMYDNAGRAELAKKLREDIKKLLTDDQKKLVQ